MEAVTPPEKIVAEAFLAADDLKQRKPNFTESEKYFLVRQYEEYKGILAARGDSNTNRTKHQVWQLITDELNRKNPAIQRTSSEVRKKWQNLVTTARKEIKDAEQRGLPSSQLPFLWRKVAELCTWPQDGEEDNILHEDAKFETDASSLGFSQNSNRGIEFSVKEEPAWIERASSSDLGYVPPALQNNSLIPTDNDANIFAGLSTGASTSTVDIVQADGPVHDLLDFEDSGPLESSLSVEARLKTVALKRRHPEKNSDVSPEKFPNIDLAAEKWTLEKAQRLQEMKQAEEKHFMERKKLQIETEILNIQKQKAELELRLLKHTAEKQISEEEAPRS